MDLSVVAAMVIFHPETTATKEFPGVTSSARRAVFS